MKIRDNKFGFTVSALVLFAVILLPNILWFLFPAEKKCLTKKPPFLFGKDGISASY